jgi:hypothetical protein
MGCNTNIAMLLVPSQVQVRLHSKLLCSGMDGKHWNSCSKWQAYQKAVRKAGRAMERQLHMVGKRVFIAEHDIAISASHSVALCQADL